MRKYSEIPVEFKSGLLTGFNHLDSIMSVDGGLQDAVVFMTGTSGAGKTTIAKLIQRNMSNVVTALYERETSANSVAKQTKRIPIEHDNAFIADETDCPHFNDFMKKAYEINAKLIIIDSLQTAALDLELDGMNKTEAPMQVLLTLKKWKAETGGTAILIGWVNKDGDFSGVNGIKQLSDCHAHLVFDEAKNERTLTTTKNRDNSTGKLYYEFVDTDSVIEFYTEKEFKLKNNKQNFSEYLAKVTTDFLSGVDRKNPSFNAFKKEFFSRIENISEDGKTDLQITIETIKVIDELTTKYGL